MPRGKAQTKRHHRRRRNQEFQAELRQRRLERRTRHEIHAAMEQATEMVSSKRTAKAPDKKNSTKGWRVEDAETGRIIEFAESRDAARLRAKEINDAPTDRDEAMRKLGWWRIGDIGPVELRFRRVPA